MDTKITPSYWTDPKVEDLPTEGKLASMWMLTNPGISLAGVTEYSTRRFQFETGMDPKVIGPTVTAMGDSFVWKPDDANGSHRGGVIWARNFIRHQFGDGDALRRNRIAVAVASEVQGLSDSDLRDAIFKEYPALLEVLEEQRGHAKPKAPRADQPALPGLDPAPPAPKGMASPTEGDGKGMARAPHGVREEKSRSINREAKSIPLSTVSPGEAPSPPAAGRAPPSPFHAFIDAWAKMFEKEHRGEKYVFQSGKDAAAVKRLLAQGIAPETLLAVARAAWGLSGVKTRFVREQSLKLSTFASDFVLIRDAVKQLLPSKAPELESAPTWAREEMEFLEIRMGQAVGRYPRTRAGLRECRKDAVDMGIHCTAEERVVAVGAKLMSDVASLSRVDELLRQIFQASGRPGNEFEIFLLMEAREVGMSPPASAERHIDYLEQRLRSAQAAAEARAKTSKP